VQGRGSKVGAVSVGVLGAGLGNALGAPNNLGGRYALAGLAVFGGIGGYLGRAIRLAIPLRTQLVRRGHHAARRSGGPDRVVGTGVGADRRSCRSRRVQSDRFGTRCFEAYGSFGRSGDTPASRARKGSSPCARIGTGRRLGVGATPPERISWDQSIASRCAGAAPSTAP